MTELLDLMILPQPDAVGKEAAERFRTLVLERLKEADSFSVALSGGSTPQYLHRALVHDADRIPWKKIDVFLGDERAVAPTDDASNFKMVKDTLLGHVPVDPERVYRPRAEADDLRQAADEYEATLMAVTGNPPQLDLVFLGLGDDGHTASLFPGEPEPAGWVAATRAPADTAARGRLTLSYAALESARHVIVMVTGERKATVLEHILEDDCELPMARLVRRRGTHTTMLVDQAAASRIAREESR